MKQILLTLLTAVISIASSATVCNKYKFDRGLNAVPGNITIIWSISTGYNNCGFKKEDIRNRKFAVAVTNWNREVLVRDTTDFNYYRFNSTLMRDSVLLFSIVELGGSDPDPDPYMTFIRLQQEQLPKMQSQIDSLNNYLLNGYFCNALSILYDMKRVDLVDEIIVQYRILFPEHYPGERYFFNSYLDNESQSLTKMPYATGLKEFIKSINQASKGEKKQNFWVRIKVSGENQMMGYEVFPPESKYLFDKASSLLKFTNQGKGSADVVLKIGRSRSRKAYVMVNKRALTDPNAPNFKTEYRFRGSVH